MNRNRYNCISTMSDLMSSSVKKNRRGSRGKGRKSDTLNCDNDTEVSQSCTKALENKQKKKMSNLKSYINTESDNIESHIRSVTPKFEKHPRCVSLKIKKKTNSQDALQSIKRHHKSRSFDNDNVKSVCKNTKSPTLNVSTKVNRKIKHTTKLYGKIQNNHKYRSRAFPSVSNVGIQSCAHNSARLRISTALDNKSKSIKKRTTNIHKDAVISEVKMRSRYKTKTSLNIPRDSVECDAKSFLKLTTSPKRDKKYNICILEESESDIDDEQTGKIDLTSVKKCKSRRKNFSFNSTCNDKSINCVKVNKNVKTLLKESVNTDKSTMKKQKASLCSIYDQIDKIDMCIKNIKKVKMAFEVNKKARKSKGMKKEHEKNIPANAKLNGLNFVNDILLSPQNTPKKKNRSRKKKKMEQSLNKSEKGKAEDYLNTEIVLLEAIQNMSISEQQWWKSEEMNRKNWSKQHFNECLKYKAENGIIGNMSIDCTQEIEDISLEGKEMLKKMSKAKAKEKTFPKLLEKAEILEILQHQDPNNPKYIQGNFRINPRFYKHGYLSMPGSEPDLLIIGLCDRNRAFDGDLVVAQIKPEEEWHTHSNKSVQKTGVIVCILEKVHSRKAVGLLKQQGSSTFLYPRDHRLPLIRLYPESLPKRYFSEPHEFENILFLAEIVQWKAPLMALGTINQIIGIAGDIKSESLAILLLNDLDVTPYSNDLIDNIPSTILTPQDIADREDWRGVCILTIDPETATDLDDALSCKLLSNGNYEIGIHISDVTHYLKYRSPLDIAVSKRATTVYMANNVYHMLPQDLCEMCSLLPGRDRLAFSVIIEMTPDAKVVERRFAKTVINSCCQMSYPKAQMMIDMPENDWPVDFLNVEGNFEISQISVAVNYLYKLSVKLCNKRFADGALRIDQPKLHVIMDRETEMPVSYYIEERTEAKNLIEEFMLLANMEVANHLYNTIPEIALLRRHKKPAEHVLSATRDMLQMFGVHLDIETAGSLHASLKHYEVLALSELDEMKHYTAEYRMMVINNLCAKAMTCAQYKCLSSVINKEDLEHYALNVPLYTHFTSPIRRYADCVVHRLLYSTMEKKPLEGWTSELCSKIANICTRKKNCAKIAQAQNNELYFSQLVDMSGSMTVTAVVTEVKENNIDVILCRFGLKLRIYLTPLKDQISIEYVDTLSVPMISIMWKESEVAQIITVFSVITVQIKKHPDLFRLTGTIVPP